MMRFFALGITLFLPAVAGAADAVPTYGSAALKMIWALLLVIGVILLLYAVVRKRFSAMGPASGAIQVKEMRYLMPKKGVAIVEVRGREYLLGIGINRIEMLTPLPPREDGGEEFAAVLKKNTSSPAEASQT